MTGGQPHDMPETPRPDEDDASQARTAASWLAGRLRPWLALLLVVALVLPLGGWLVDEVLYRHAASEVEAALGGDATLARALLLVRSTSCTGRVSTGSAFVVALDGEQLVVTNRHVVRDADLVGLRRLDGSATLEVTGIALSRRADVAVLELADPGQRPAGLEAGSSPRVGDEIRTVGFPSGEPTLLEGTVVDAGTRRLEADLRTDPGASGSPVLDGSGAVVGQIFARTDAGNGLATPIDALRSAVDATVPAPGC